MFHDKYTETRISCFEKGGQKSIDISLSLQDEREY